MSFQFSTSTASKLKLIAVFVVLGVVGGQCAVNRLLLRQRGDVALRADSLEVSLDSTRRVLVGSDSTVNFWQRRAYQSNMRADALDKKLKQESKVRANLAFSIDSLSTVLSSVVRDSAGTRIANFHTYDEPFTVDIGVQLPAPPDTGVARVEIAIDTAHVGVRVGCGKPVDGVKPANVTVSTPAWLNVNVDSASQDVSVCNTRKPSRFKDALKFGFGVLVGFFLK